MRPLSLKIVLTLTCLVTLALFGEGNQAAAGVITVGTESKIGGESFTGMIPDGNYSWDLVDFNKKPSAECTISAAESDSIDITQMDSLLNFQAKTFDFLWQPTQSGTDGNRLNQLENDSAGALLTDTTLSLFTFHNNRRIHSSDQAIPDPAMRDISQPPRS